MTWFRVDDNFESHPKTSALSDAAVGVWTRLGSWCARFETNGVVPRHHLCTKKVRKKLVDELVSSRMLHESGTKNARGWSEFYIFNDWEDYQGRQLSDQDREEKRRYEREKKRRQRGNVPKMSPPGQGQCPVSNTNTNTNTNSPDGESSETSVPDQPKPPKFANEVREIFRHWCHRMGKTQAAKLKGKRKSKVEARLRDGYTVEDIKRAIDGCAESPFHMGENDDGRRYDDLELICRDGSKLEQFRDRAGKPKHAVDDGKRIKRDKLDQVRHRLRFVDPATNPEMRASLLETERQLMAELGIAGAA